MIRPRQTVTATVTTDKPDRQGRPRPAWTGATTTSTSYHWAGRVDSAAAAGNDTIWTTDQVGTNYGGDRDTDDWVSVIAEDVPIATGEFTGTSSTFTVPSWAPALVTAIARWECRLTIDRGGRDVDTRGEFTVRHRHRRRRGRTRNRWRWSAAAAETDIDIALSSPVYRAGETITGQVDPDDRTMDLPDGDLAVSGSANGSPIH